MPTDSFPLFGEMRWTSAELAEALLITQQRVGQLSKEHILPKPLDGLYRPVESVASYIKHLKQREAGKSLAGEAVRKLQLENEMRAIKLRKIAGALVPVLQVQQDFFELARRIRDHLLNLPSRLSGPFAAEARQEKIFEVFTEEINQALSELSSGPTAGRTVSGAPVGEVSEPGQSPDETDALDQVSTSPPADPTFDEAFLDRDRGADDENDKFVTGD